MLPSRYLLSMELVPNSYLKNLQITQPSLISPLSKHFNPYQDLPKRNLPLHQHRVFLASYNLLSLMSASEIS
jgi:hypothetical protein